MALAKAAARFPIGRILASPLGRAQETALAVSKACGVPIETDDRLAEIDYGIYEGTPRSGEGYQKSKREPFVRFPGGESAVHAAARVYALLDELKASDDERDTLLVCHGGNSPVAQILSRELRSELGISPFILSSGAFSHPDVTATISPGNVWDFHGGEMETSMVMAVDPSLVKLETSEAGIPTAFKDNKALKPYGSVSIGWVSEDWKTADGKPIGIGGDPSGASAEKGRIILETSAKVLVPGLMEIRDWTP